LVEASTVSATTDISGSAKVALSSDRKAIESIIQLTIDTGDISVDGYPDEEAEW